VLPFVGRMGVYGRSPTVTRKVVVFDAFFVKKLISCYFTLIFFQEKENVMAWMTSYKSQFVKTESTKDHTSQCM
jgi:hypothetical protein